MNNVLFVSEDFFFRAETKHKSINNRSRNETSVFDGLWIDFGVILGGKMDFHQGEGGTRRMKRASSGLDVSEQGMLQ